MSVFAERLDLIMYGNCVEVNRNFLRSEATSVGLLVLDCNAKIGHATSVTALSNPVARKCARWVVVWGVGCLGWVFVSPLPPFRPVVRPCSVLLAPYLDTIMWPVRELHLSSFILFLLFEPA